MKYLNNRLTSDLQFLNRVLSCFIVVCAPTFSACSNNNESMDNVTVTPAENELVTLDAQVAQWDSSISIAYTITSHSGDNIIVFDGQFGGKDNVLIPDIDGTEVRLFKGQIKIKSGSILFLTEPLIGGRLMMPYGSLTGFGSIDLPIESPDPSGSPVDKIPLSPSLVEFCISYEIATDDVVGDGDYPLYIDLDAPQSLTCTMLAQPE